MPYQWYAINTKDSTQNLEHVRKRRSNKKKKNKNGIFLFYSFFLVQIIIFEYTFQRGQQQLARFHFRFQSCLSWFKLNTNWPRASIFARAGQLYIVDVEPPVGNCRKLMDQPWMHQPGCVQRRGRLQSCLHLLARNKFEYFLSLLLVGIEYFKRQIPVCVCVCAVFVISLFFFVFFPPFAGGLFSLFYASKEK